MLEHYGEQERDFVSKIVKYKKQVEKNDKVILTRFLTMREQVIINEIFGHPDYSIYEFFGGYEDAERKRCFICPSYMTIYDEIFDVKCYKIEYNKRYVDLNHQNVLGSLMALKVDRSLFGDIIFDEHDDCYFFVSKEIENLILTEFKTVGKYPISLKDYQGKVNYRKKYKLREVIVSSIRLDTVISSVLNVSRNQASELISKGAVSVNSKLTYYQATKCEVKDIISVRKFGRIIIDGIKGKTKRSKLIVIVKQPIS
ncbi:YlmH family RNA-binding protein [Haloplasma contractile]|uniref:S4 domain protein n=1 Tax=Haloplasma contractile SSD-17B TaxID=1033810 RepID=U2DZI7_9MOLU|nr:YlmH/Sll1252 family protein [Haloplasma contractile]ERJ13612.1 S4 domain protein [Haloplasma contractile SSD-17B]